MPAKALMREIHNTGANPYRMPAILATSDFEAWIEGDQEAASTLLKQYSTELMVAHPVSTQVNSPHNDGPELIEPVRLDSSSRDVPVELDLFSTAAAE